jgi:hypothetical protein
MVKIFISYRRDDAAGHAGHIRTLLEPEFGSDAVFLDVDHIPPGGKFGEVLAREVAKCDLLLALIGRDWLIDRTGKRRVEDQRAAHVARQTGQGGPMSAYCIR